MDGSGLGPETRALLEAAKKAAADIIEAMGKMDDRNRRVKRTTHSIGMALPLAAPTRLLTANEYRLYYMIQNHDGANYLAFSPQQTVTAGAFLGNEGTHVAFGQNMTRNDDLDEVWAIPNTAAVNITVVEVTEIPDSKKKKQDEKYV